MSRSLAFWQRLARVSGYCYNLYINRTGGSVYGTIDRTPAENLPDEIIKETGSISQEQLRELVAESAIETREKMQRIRGLLHYLQQDSLQLEIRRHDTIDLICSLREVIYFWPVEMQEKMDITCRIQHYEERDLKKMASRLCIYEPDYIFLTQAKMLLDDFYANEFRNRYRENPLANR